MDHTLHEKWRVHFGYEDANGDMAMGDAPTFEQVFSPFALELDWRVASWAVQEGIGQKTLDQLFSIPGVGPASSSVPVSNHHTNLALPPMQVMEHLGLSYHNARKLHQILDDIPPHAEWQTQSLWFRSDCNGSIFFSLI